MLHISFKIKAESISTFSTNGLKVSGKDKKIHATNLNFVVGASQSLLASFPQQSAVFITSYMDLARMLQKNTPHCSIKIGFSYN